MHENLNTTFSLKAKRNEKKTINNWQTLAPGFEYGTFFILYGKIRGDINKGLFTPKECDLYLQNYKGNITIGLTYVEEIDIAFDDTLKEVVYLLYVHVKALHANENLLNQSLIIKNSPSILDYKKDKKDNDYLNQLNPNYRIRVEIIFDELDKEIFDMENLSKSVLIDSINYERDGDKIESKNNNINIEHIIDRKPINGVILTKKCYPTYAKMVL